MVVKHISLVDKPLEIGFLNSFKEAMKLEMGMLLVINIMLFVFILTPTIFEYMDYRASKSDSSKKRLKSMFIALAIIAVSLIFGISCFIRDYRIEIKPTNVAEASVAEVRKNRNLYVLDGDNKAIEKMSNSLDIIYIDQNGHIFNKFPNEVSDKEKNEAVMNGDKIKSVTLYGSATDELVKQFVKSKMAKHDVVKILSVKDKNHEVTIQYASKR